MFEPLILEYLLFIAIWIVFSIVLISVLFYWSSLAKKALDMGKIRMESMREIELDMVSGEDKQDYAVEYTYLKK